MIGAYAALSGLLAIAVVALVSGHLPPQPFMAIGYLAFEAIAVLTVALTLGTRLPAMAAGAISVVLFGVGWFVGVLGNVAVAFDAQALQRATEAFRFLLPTDGLWRGVIFGLEPPLVLLHVGGSHRRGEPVLRADAAARGVHGLERGVGAARARRRRRAVPAPRALARAAASLRSPRAPSCRTGSTAGTSVPAGRRAL